MNEIALSKDIQQIVLCESQESYQNSQRWEI